MSERTVDDVNRIIARIEHMPYGAARTSAALLECNKVEAEGPDECRAYAYNTLVESYNLGNEPEKGYVPFTRVVTLFDAHPEWFDDKDRFDMFWSFKWMVNGLSDYPTVPRAQIEATLADMERRFAENSLGMDAPRQARFFWSWHIGDERTEEYLNEWLATPRDRMSDCILCSAGDKVTFLVLKGRMDEALERMDAILNDPDARRSCRSEPGSMFAAVMLAYLNRNEPGDVAEAVQLYRRVRAFLDDSDQQLLSASGRCIVFLAQGHNVDLALDYLKRHAELLDQAESPMSRLAFLRGAGAGMRIIAEDLGMADYPVPFTGHGDTVGQLWQWIREETLALAAAFDARNGTTAVTDEVYIAWSSHALPEPIDLSVVPAFDEALPGMNTQDAVAFVRPDSDVAPTFVPQAGAEGDGAGQTENQSDDGTDSKAPSTATAGQKLLAKAEWSGRRGELEAAGLYIDAARAFEADGALQDAAFAWAEAGHVASDHEDYAGAERCLTRAMGVLYAIGTPVNYVVPVGLCLVGVYGAQRRWDDAESLIAQLHTRVTDALLELESRNTADDRDKKRAEHMKSLLLQTDLGADSSAAELARLQGDFALASKRFLAAAESLADLGNVRAAARAFVNAGESLERARDERAIYAYESAMEAWSILRMRNERMNAANHLVDALRSFGHDEQADELAESL